MTHETWLGFHGLLFLLLGFELVFSKLGTARLTPERKRIRQQRNAIAATALWVATALLFAIYVLHADGAHSATQFLAGYAIEEALSIDNLFVFLLLFRLFKIPEVSQPRVLFWGVLGAIVMRGAFVAAGIGLLERFAWVSYVFAVVLLVAAVRLVLPQTSEPADEPEKPPVWIRWISRIHPVSARTDAFFVTENGTGMVSMLFLTLLSIEFADIVFALDSIPAVLSITREPFLAYSSNILAVMGLRSLFFLLARALKQLRYLHYGLAVVLAFAAGKMLLERVYEVGPLTSLAIVLLVLGITIALSVAHPQPDRAT